MPQICLKKTFNQLKRNKDKELVLTKSCIKIKKKALELTYQHLWIRKDGSKIIDSREVLEDYKCRKCIKSRKEKNARICGI